jgi:hypothetical protein
VIKKLDIVTFSSKKCKYGGCYSMFTLSSDSIYTRTANSTYCYNALGGFRIANDTH